MSVRGRAAALGIIVAFTAGAAPASAQSACSARGNIASRVAAREWPAPLDREVTLQGDSLTLREGLARLATAARVRLSYVAELLPLDRPHCLSYRAVAAGEVLDDLLRGTQVEPVIAGDDQVVLAPSRRIAAAVPDDEVQLDRRASMLDRVVVLGAAESAPDRSMPVAVAVVGREKLAQQESASLTHILDGAVPGLWMWQSSPNSLAARYGSVRGASSFGLSHPKIYVDGIEVANPLLVKQFDPSTIERIEVIRGPQGAALYGADAISGVINIVTRHDGAAANGQRLQLRSTAGVTGSEFASGDVLTQQHGLTFRTGTSERSGGFGLSVTTLGAYIPGAFSRTIAGNGGFRVIGSHSVFTGTARLLSEDAGTPRNPLLSELAPLTSAGVLPRQPIHRGGGRPGDQPRYMRSGTVRGPNGPTTSSGFMSPTLHDTAATQSVRQYTIGTTLSVTPNDRWTHAFVFGVDGYRLRNPSVDNGPIPSAVDSALTAAQGGSDRVTARVSSTVRFGALESATADLTVSAEHSAAREESLVRTMIAGDIASSKPGEWQSHGGATLTGWRANSGVVAQANTSLRNRLFLTAGMRVERVESLVGLSHVAALPMIGGAMVGDRGDVTLKVRAAYGKGIRPVEGAIRELALGGRRTALVTYDLAPEQQSGVEAGADLFLGRTLGLHVTRFDQRATGLIQSVAVAIPWERDGGPGIDDNLTGTYVAYQLQNVGEIGNRGWELEGSADLGRLALSGTLSLVDSRVLRLANGYSGDLQPGDRMLDVPARTMTLAGSWTGRRWFTSLSVSRAMDWTGYDRLALAESLTSTDVAPGELVESDLRSFWREYDGVTRLRATFSRDLFRGLAFVMTGDNLLGRQRDEPDNVTVIPGLTVTAGVKAKF